MFQTLDEWQDYIGQLAGNRLLSKAIAANTQAFADIMLDEGYDLDFVEAVVRMFVRQLVRTETFIPGGGAFDLADMAALDPVARKGATLSRKEIEAMEENPPPEPPDEVDEMADEADEVDLDEDWGEPLPV